MTRRFARALRSRDVRCFPRLYAGIREFLFASRWHQRDIRSAYLFGSFLRHSLGGVEPFADIDLAAGSRDDSMKLRSLQRQRVMVFDFNKRMLRDAPIEVIRAVCSSPAHLLHFLEDVTISGIVYSFSDNKLWYTDVAWEALSGRVVQPNELADVSPLRILCRTFAYLARGYRCSPEALAALLERQQGQWAIRRWAARQWMRRTYRDRLLVSPRGSLA